MFRAALFVIVKKGNQPKCLATQEWPNCGAFTPGNAAQQQKEHTSGTCGNREEPRGDADQKPDRKEHLLSESSFVKFKNRCNQRVTELRIRVTLGV